MLYCERYFRIFALDIYSSELLVAVQCIDSQVLCSCGRASHVYPVIVNKDVRSVCDVVC